ncbi:MAG: MBL fold metallo-hydrolase [Nitrososphaerota archaeon]|nr:MBL fold metallo-hydrolase [Nitrososphaerota archaeon]
MQTLSDGIHYLGTVGIPPTTAIYLVMDQGDSAIIEPGPNSGSVSVIRMIREASVPDGSITKLVATHIHLDHAGASQALLNHFPGSRLYVYQGAAKYLTDNTQLVESASKILGPLFSRWGGMPAVDGDRITEINEAFTVKVGRIQLKPVYTPGHAPFHMSLWDEKSRTLFTGDAVGMYVSKKETLWPASPLPSFRFDMEMQSLSRIISLEPKTLCIPHFEPVTHAKDFLNLNLDIYGRWHDVLGSLKDKSDVEGAARKLVSVIDSYRWLPGDPNAWFTLKMHVSGFLQYEATKR